MCSVGSCTHRLVSIMKVRFLILSISVMSLIAAMGIPKTSFSQGMTGVEDMRMSSLQFDSFRLAHFAVDKTPLYMLPLDGVRIDRVTYDGAKLDSSARAALEKSIKRLVACGYQPSAKVQLIGQEDEVLSFEGAMGLNYNPEGEVLWEQSAQEQETSSEFLASCIYHLSGQDLV